MGFSNGFQYLKSLGTYLPVDEMDGTSKIARSKALISQVDYRVGTSDKKLEGR